MRRLLALAVVLGACSVPPLKLQFDVSSALDKSCGGATACTGVPMACDAVASIRILDPAQPSAPYLSQCQRIVLDTKKDLCSLAGIDLKQDPLPEQTLQVEVVIYEASQIATDPITGDLVCPTEKEGLTFDAATGFPTGTIAMIDPADPTKMLHPTPAIGGRAFWHPGDDAVTVELACNDLGALNQASCSGSDLLMATATVEDFDQGLTVTAGIANLLTVRLGEPKLVPGSTDIDFALGPADTRPLDRTADVNPAWGASVDLVFDKAACLEVLEDAPMATATVTCKAASATTTSIDITGERLAKASLDNILTAIQGTTGMPYSLAGGLTVGLVREFDGSLSTAAHRITATTPAGDRPMVDYISQNGTTLNDVSTDFGMHSSTLGIFLSRDTPFGTKFSTADSNGGTLEQIGGLVDGKVTIIVFHLAKPPQNQ